MRLLGLLDRLDSLVQSQARELSQLRQQVTESRKLGALQRRQLEDLNKAFTELLQANNVDCYMGEVVKEQLDKSLGILDRLEGRLDRGSNCGNTSHHKKVIRVCDCSLKTKYRQHFTLPGRRFSFW